MSDTRYIVRGGIGKQPGGFVVLDTETGEHVREYALRTNWIDGREGRPYGPSAAAQEIARRFNAGLREQYEAEVEAREAESRIQMRRAALAIGHAESGALPGPSSGGHGLWQTLDTQDGDGYRSLF